MTKLNQIIAVASSKKTQAQSALTKAYHSLQKPELFCGIERVYQPKDDEGEQLPPESTKVQFKIGSILESVLETWTNMFDVIITQDAGNQLAMANVVIDNEVILEDVPVTTLIFLEKQLNDFTNLVGKIPTLSEAESWNYNKEHEVYISDEVQTHRTKKVQKPIVLYPATPEHAAQTQLVTEDIIAGFWKTKKLTSALSNHDKEVLLSRVLQLKEAVIKAREQANSTEIKQIEQGNKVINFIIKDIF